MPSRIQPATSSTIAAASSTCATLRRIRSRSERIFAITGSAEMPSAVPMKSAKTARSAPRAEEGSRAARRRAPMPASTGSTQAAERDARGGAPEAPDQREVGLEAGQDQQQEDADPGEARRAGCAAADRPGRASAWRPGREMPEHARAEQQARPRARRSPPAARSRASRHRARAPRAAARAAGARRGAADARTPRAGEARDRNSRDPDVTFRARSGGWHGERASERRGSGRGRPARDLGASLDLEERLEGFRSLDARARPRSSFVSLDTRAQARCSSRCPPTERQLWMRQLAAGRRRRPAPGGRARGARGAARRARRADAPRGRRRCSPTPRTRPAA